MTSEHITGFIVGLGAAALGFYLYKTNQTEIDEFLKKQGINIPGGGNSNTGSMTLEELVAEKEKLEDLIAEREMAAQADVSKN